MSSTRSAMVDSAEQAYDELQVDLRNAIRVAEPVDVTQPLVRGLQWRNPLAVKRCNELVSLLGQPAVADPSSGGLARWNHVDILTFRVHNPSSIAGRKSATFSWIMVKDEGVPHFLPEPHWDFLYMGLRVSLPSTFQARYHSSMWYDPSQRRLKVRCCDVPTALVKLYMALAAATGMVDPQYSGGHMMGEFQGLSKLLRDEQRYGSSGGAWAHESMASAAPFHYALCKYIAGVCLLTTAPSSFRAGGNTLAGGATSRLSVGRQTWLRDRVELWLQTQSGVKESQFKDKTARLALADQIVRDLQLTPAKSWKREVSIVLRTRTTAGGSSAAAARVPSDSVPLTGGAVTQLTPREQQVLRRQVEDWLQTQSGIKVPHISNKPARLALADTIVQALPLSTARSQRTWRREVSIILRTRTVSGGSSRRTGGAYNPSRDQLQVDVEQWVNDNRGRVVPRSDDTKAIGALARELVNQWQMTDDRVADIADILSKSVRNGGGHGPEWNTYKRLTSSDLINYYHIVRGGTKMTHEEAYQYLKALRCTASEVGTLASEYRFPSSVTRCQQWLRFFVYQYSLRHKEQFEWPTQKMVSPKPPSDGKMGGASQKQQSRGRGRGRPCGPGMVRSRRTGKCVTKLPESTRGELKAFGYRAADSFAKRRVALTHAAHALGAKKVAAHLQLIANKVYRSQPDNWARYQQDMTFLRRSSLKGGRLAAVWDLDTGLPRQPSRR